MSISGLTGNAGFLTDSLFFNDPSLVSHLNADSSISFSYDVGNTSGTYATFNFANRFYINEGPSVQALFATRETSVVIDVPEPASLALLGAGAGALAIARRRRRG
jgi:hypothetical protein